MTALSDSTPTPSRIHIRTRGTDHGQTSAHNRFMVWEMFRQHGPQSRHQLKQLSHMGNSTLTYLVRDLMAIGLVRTKGKRESDRVGKKQELLEINPEYGVFAGFFLEGGEVSATLVDATGQEIDHRRLQCAADLPSTLDVIADYLNDRSVQDVAPLSDIRGMGLAIPGIVDCTEGRVLQCWRLNLNQYNLAEDLDRRWSMPHVIENDVRLAAWSEAERLAADLPDAMLFLAINASGDGDDSEGIYGMGMSMIQNGQLQVGAHNSAGELEKFRALWGDLELSRQDVALLREAEAAMAPAVERYAVMLGNMLAILADLLDPDLVVLGGSLEIRCRAFLDSVEQHVARERVHSHTDPLCIRTSMLGERGVANGAAMLARRSVIHEALVNYDGPSSRNLVNDAVS